MDVGDASPTPSVRFGPDRRITAVFLAGAVVAAVSGWATSDGPGRLLAVGVAVVLIAYAVTDLLFSPRLRADAAGVVIRTPSVRAVLRWADVDRVEVDERSRFGLASRTLEIDAGTTLVVLSRRALGTDPREALTVIQAVAPQQ